MKVMFVEHSLKGHREIYLKKLAYNSSADYISESFLFTREYASDPNITIIKSSFNERRNIRNYFKLLCYIKAEAKRNKIDLIHFLDADLYYRFWGMFLWLLKDFKIIMTFHHLYTYGWRKYSIKQIFSKISCGVVHTKFLYEELMKSGIKNITHIEYPVFKYNEISITDCFSSKVKWGLPKDVPILGVIGGTQRYKGLNILLEALKKVKCPFHLFIAGKEADFSYEYIDENIKEYKNNVTLVLRGLTDVEYNMAIAAVDIILLPYLKQFNGASGPLADGVCLEKTIIGSDHGSLGDLISRNHIGKTFISENIEDLSSVLNQVLTNIHLYDEVALEYKNSLKPNIFVKQYEELYKNLLNKI